MTTDMAAQAKAALMQAKSSNPVRRLDNAITCPTCGKGMQKRSGRYGEFYGCTGYPACKKTLSLDQVKANFGRLNVERLNGQPLATQPPVREFKPSQFQLDVFDFISNGTGNAVVEAVAGSGKTTTIVKALELTPKSASVLFCAFNKHIQQELARRAPMHVEVSTIHSIGFRALQSNLSVKPEVDSGKLYGICKELLPPEKDQWHLRQVLSTIVSYCKKTLVDPTDTAAIEVMVDYYDLDVNCALEEVVHLVPQAMALCAERSSVIDFDDMLWLPIALNIPIPKFDWVFVDEAQDLSPAQLEIVKRSIKANGRVVTVGDRNQSIYGFTGADTRAIPRLIEELQATTLPLSISYRCPRLVVEMAQTIVPQIQPPEWAEDGVVEHTTEYKLMSQVVDGDLILCRVNAPLVKVCYSLIRRGVKATIRGRDIGKGLLDLIDKLAPYSILDLMDKVREYKEHETAKLEKAGKTARIMALTDKCECLVALCDGVRDLSELRYKIKTIFDDNEGTGVVLSSIHRSKGDEADRVFLLHPELLPHPLAKKDWQLDQEKNLQYVAYTRSKREFWFVD